MPTQCFVLFTIIVQWGHNKYMLYPNLADLGLFLFPRHKKAVISNIFIGVQQIIDVINVSCEIIQPVIYHGKVGRML